MKTINPIFLCLFILLWSVSFNANAQNYTYNPTKPGCNQTWANGNCWDRTTNNNPTGCTGSTSLTPPLAPTSTCRVNVIIRHDLTYTGNMSLGGNFNSIRVEGGANFTVTGNVNILGQRIIRFDIRESSQFNVGNQLIIEPGANNGIQTTLNITGDNTGNIIVNEIDLRGQAILNILADGRLTSRSTTRYNGNSSVINVYGFFRTSQVEIMGGNQHQLNSFDGAQIIIDNDLNIGGSAQIEFGGNSEVDVGGNINAVGNSKVTASTNAKVHVCGTYPTPCPGCNTTEISAGKFIPGCRILPVDFLVLEVNYLPGSKATSFRWSTAKEWENSHFEIERSVDSIDEFQKIDQVDGMGWKDTITEYEYTDTNIPLGKSTLYYRLKQVDFDGTAIYSKTLSVATPGLHFTQGVWRAHPNPFTSNSLQVSLLDTELYDNQELTFRLIQPTSSSPEFTVRSIDEMNEMMQNKLGAMGKGIIILEIRWAAHIEHLKILKR